MPVQQEYRRAKITLPFGAADQVKSEDIYIAGEMSHFHLRLPQTSAATGTLTLEDQDGYEIYNSTAKNDNANYNLAERRFLSGKTTVKVALNVAAGGAHNIVVVIYYKGHRLHVY